MKISCFKSYDVRGIVPHELNVDVVRQIIWGIVAVSSPKTAVLGRDVREHSPWLANAAIKALTNSGVDVFDLGLCGTEEVYFHTGDLDADLGIMITASHNPAEYNGKDLCTIIGIPALG